MSTEVSPSTGKKYGVLMVCIAFDIARSSYYSAQSIGRRQKVKPGPKSKWSDEQMLIYIKADIKRSKFTGEGHRKIWFRLRLLDEVYVGRNRVLRVMRANKLLSPHRARRKNRKRQHDGKIVTQQPNEMWGTDGTRVFTEEDGNAWIFVAIDHFNCECVGWNVTKRGTRYEALEPIAMGLGKYYSGVARDAARGLSLRMDHGTQYQSDHFRNQLKFWGIHPSWAFISQPQTNGVAERFFRTLKEQCIYGRYFKNIESLRIAVSKLQRTLAT